MTVSKARFQRGYQLGRFTIEELIGHGGLGAVYRGRSDTGEPVAIKVSKKPATELTSYQFICQQNEIDVLKRLNHKSLVRLIDFNLDQEDLYIVMELVEGELLSDYLTRRGSLEVIEAIRIVRAVSEALAHCHEFNILHHDLKPNNIVLIDPYEPRLKILDFGLAHVRQTGEKRLPKGTVAYMAPELLVVGGASEPTPRVDLYSVGVMLYELLTGELPFAADDFIQHVKRKLDCDLARPSAVPEKLMWLIRSLLEPAPEERFGSAVRLCVNLRALYYEMLGSTANSIELTKEMTRESVAPGHVPFAGRERELDDIRYLFRTVSPERGVAVVVVGEAGLGKTRLIGEVLSHSDFTHEALVAYGRCRDLRGCIPYAPIREALSQFGRTLKALPGADAARLRSSIVAALASDWELLVRLVPEFAALSPDKPEATTDLSFLLRVGSLRVAEAFRRIFEALGRERRFVLALEDLHWADEGTREVLEQLVQPKVPPGVFMLGTSRPQGSTARGVELVRLHALSNEENVAMLKTLLPGSDDATIESLKRAIPLLVAGNPLFNCQIVQSLWLDEHIQRGSDGSPLISSAFLADYQPPESLSGVLQKSLERFAPGVTKILAVGALLGRQFSIKDLEELDLFPRSEIRAALAAAERQYLCYLEHDRCNFVHDTICEYLETKLQGEGRAEVHARIAGQLERSGAAPAAFAHHLEAAGDFLEASRAYLDAAIEADSLHDLTGAYKRLEKGFELLKDLPPDPTRNSILTRFVQEIARIGCMLGDTKRPLEYMNEWQNAVETPTPEELLTINSSYARVHYVSGNFPEAVAFSRTVLAAAGDDPRLRTYMTVPANILGRALCASGKFGPAVQMLREGCKLADEAGKTLERSHSEGLLSVALGFTGDFKGAEESADRCAELARKLGDPVRELAAHFYYSVLGETSFRWDFGVQHSVLLLSRCEQESIGGLYLYVGTMFAGRHQFHVGQLERARVLVVNAINLSELFGISMGVGWAHAFLGDINFVRGRWDDARRCYEKGLACGNAGGKDEYAAPLALIGLAHTGSFSGMGATAVCDLAEEARDRYRAVGNTTALIQAEQRYAEALETVGDAAHARDVRREREERLAQLEVSPLDWWPVWPDVPPSVAAAGLRRGSDTTSSNSGYWQELWRVGEAAPGAQGIEDPALDHRELDESSRRTPNRPLFERLSTVEGYLPEYVTIEAGT